MAESHLTTNAAGQTTPAVRPKVPRTGRGRSLLVSDLIELPGGTFALYGGAQIDPNNLEPLDTALRILDRAARESIDTIYPLFWINRVCATGGSVSVCWMRDRDERQSEGDVDGGFVERLLLYEPCDEYMELRTPRFDAFREHMQRHDARDAVVSYINRAGHFCDNRPFASAEEAVERALSVGIRLMIDSAGELDPKPSSTVDMLDREFTRDWPMKRTWQRFQATARQPGREAEIISIIRERGSLHEGSGFVVLEGKSA